MNHLLRSRSLLNQKHTGILLRNYRPTLLSEVALEGVSFEQKVLRYLIEHETCKLIILAPPVECCTLAKNSGRL